MPAISLKKVSNDNLFRLTVDKYVHPVECFFAPKEPFLD